MATYSDLFTGANGAALDSTKWKTPVATGITAPLIYANHARGTGAYTCAVLHDVNCPTGANQYAEGSVSRAVGLASGFVVRHSLTAKTGYAVVVSSNDDGMNPLWDTVTLYKYVAGSPTTLGTFDDGVSTFGSVRLEAEGSTIRVKSGASTLISVTDTSYATGYAGVFATSNSTSAWVDGFGGGDLAVTSSPTTVSVDPVTLAVSGSAARLTTATTVEVAPATLAISGAVDCTRKTTVAVEGAALALAASADFSLIQPPTDDFSRADGVLAAPYVPWGSTIASEMYLRIVGGAVTTRPTKDNGQVIYGGWVTYPYANEDHSVEIQLTSPPPQAGYASAFAYLLLRAGASSLYRIDLWMDQVIVNKGGTGIYSAPWAPCAQGDYFRAEVGGDRIRVYRNGTLVVDLIDTTFREDVDLGTVSTGPVVHGGNPGFGVSKDFYIDNFRVSDAPVARTVAVEGALLALTSGGADAPKKGTVSVPQATLGLSGAVGRPVAATVSVQPATLALTGSATGAVSREKTTRVFPSFSAFGGLDPYTGTVKGQITADGDWTIGYRKGLNLGDRVFFTLDSIHMPDGNNAGNLIHKATFHFTVMSCMSYDILSTGADANPSGPMFKVRKVVSGQGMDALLEGDYGTVEAKPIWLSGQTWYDSATKGNPITEMEVDVTPLYNEALTAGTGLTFALECMLSNTKWTAELFGAEIEGFRPRIELHRWGVTDIQITDTDTCTPTITVTKPVAAQGLTIRWSYDEKMTPQGGNMGWAQMEGFSNESPYTFPMLESSSRVHIEVEIDYGNNPTTPSGLQVFRRTFKTPQVFAPKLLTSGLPVKTNWLDARGPISFDETHHMDGWIALVKYAVYTWTPNTQYHYGDLVKASNGQIYACNSDGISGTTEPTGTGLPEYETKLASGSAYGVASWEADAAALNGGYLPPCPYIRPEVVMQRAPGGPYGSTLGPNAQGSYSDISDGALAWRWWDDDSRNRASAGLWGIERTHDYERTLSPWKPWRGTFWYNATLPVLSDTPAYIVDVPREPVGFPTHGTLALNVDTGWYGSGDIAGPPPLFLDDMGEPTKSQPQGSAWVVTRLGTTVKALTMRPMNGEATRMAQAPRDIWGAWWGSRLWVDEVTLGTYTSVANLQKFSATGYKGSETRAIPGDPWGAQLIAFVADGALHVYEVGATSRVPTTEIFTTSLAGYPDLTGIEMVTVETLGGACRKIIVGTTDTGTVSFMVVIAPDLVVSNDGGTFTRTPGSVSFWANTLPIKRAWASEKSLSNAGGNVPDDETCHLMAQRTDGSVIRFKLDGDNAKAESLPNFAGLAPTSDFENGFANTWNRTKHVVSRWPMADAQKTTRMANGGMVSWKIVGDTLVAERTSDELRVSEQKVIPLPSTPLEVYAPRHFALEGMDTPILTRHADGFHTVTFNVGVDISRMDCATEYEKARLTSGAVTAANFQQESLNQRLPTEFVKRPGHNTFTINWKYDPYEATDGAMNDYGWNYWKLHGVTGERVRFIIHPTPTFGGFWKNGVWRRANISSPQWQPEMGGGQQWCQIKMTTFFWTDEPPTKPNRQWHRVLDGMDYVLDGESNGGAFIVTLISPSSDLWIAFDLPSDIPTYKGDFQAWKRGPRGYLLKWTTDNGEIVDMATGLPISQSYSFDSY